MKGLILSGGTGTRMRPFTYSRAKQLLPVANKPVLHYCMDFLVAAGIRKIGVIVGDTHKQIKASLGDGSKWGAAVAYIHQDQPRGLAHAVLQAADFVGDSSFVMVLGDNLIEEDLTTFLAKFNPTTHAAAIVLREVANPRQFGVAKVAGDEILYLVEKPAEPPSNLAIMGIYLFTPHIFAAARAIKPSARGELEITDAIQYLIEKGHKVRPLTATGQWYDVGSAADLLRANTRVLNSKLAPGKVIIPASTTVINSKIEGPTIIGESCEIVNSYIGPHTSVGDGCSIVNCSVLNSILFDHSSIRNLPWVIESSVIADNAALVGPPGTSVKITAGSNCTINF